MGKSARNFTRISLQGDVPEDLALIVNSVKESYLNEVVYNARSRRIEALRKTEESYVAYDNRVRAAGKHRTTCKKPWKYRPENVVDRAGTHSDSNI